MKPTDSLRLTQFTGKTDLTTAEKLEVLEIYANEVEAVATYKDALQERIEQTDRFIQGRIGAFATNFLNQITGTSAHLALANAFASLPNLSQQEQQAIEYYKKTIESVETLEGEKAAPAYQRAIQELEENEDLRIASQKRQNSLKDSLNELRQDDTFSDAIALADQYGHSSKVETVVRTERGLFKKIGDRLGDVINRVTRKNIFPDCSLRVAFDKATAKDPDLPNKWLHYKAFADEHLRETLRCNQIEAHQQGVHQAVTGPVHQLAANTDMMVNETFRNLAALIYQHPEVMLTYAESTDQPQMSEGLPVLLQRRDWINAASGLVSQEIGRLNAFLDRNDPQLIEKDIQTLTHHPDSLPDRLFTGSNCSMLLMRAEARQSDELAMAKTFSAVVNLQSTARIPQLTTLTLPPEELNPRPLAAHALEQNTHGHHYRQGRNRSPRR